MSTMIIILGLLGTFIGVWLSYWTHLNGKRLEIFQTYVDKFNAIITPDDMQWWTKAMTNEPLPDKELPEYEIKMLRYLNLVWEEYFLYSEGMISKRLWNLWKDNIYFSIKADLCREVFDKYEDTFGPNFQQWIRKHRDL